MTDIICDDQASLYSASEFQNTYYLGYREIPGILKRFARGTNALDYGCGTGRSSRFLKKLGFEVVGVDISEAMLKLAQIEDPKGEYHLISSANIGDLAEAFDLVFSCFVFLTVSSKAELRAIFKEIYRVLKPGGIFNFVTASKYLYIKKYISYDLSPIESLSSGQKILVTLKDLGLSFQNYFWSDEDYRDLLKQAGFELMHYEMPIAGPSEKDKWLDESVFGPYVIYTAKK
jgi:SAM-dependent methyltransferase